MLDTTKYNEIAKYLDMMYNTLNEKYFENELPQCVITLQSSPLAYGHFITIPIWKADKNNYYEINISPEYINRPIAEVAATMIHEMVHYYCQINQIKETSRGGYYHNKNFKLEAEKRDLIIEYDKKIGYSPTKPSANLINFLEQDNNFQNIQMYRFSFISASETIKKENNSIKYTCPKCGGIARTTKEMWLICGNCNETMTIQEK